MRYTLFENYSKTTPLSYSAPDWTEFVANIADLCIQRHANEFTKKRRTPAISPALYENGGTRSNENVSGWGAWVALDVDNDLLYVPVEDAMTHLNGMGLNHLIYTTTKARPLHHRFRVMIPLKRELGADELKPAWKAIVQFFAALGPDASCKDVSRIYGAPSFFEPAADGNNDPYNRFEFRLDGSSLDIDAVLQAYVPDVEPEVAPCVAPPVSAGRPMTSQPKGRKRLPYGSTIHDSPVVNGAFATEYLNLGKGEHHVGLYTFMTKVAGRAKALGYAIDAATLVTYAQQLDAICPTKTARDRWLRIASEAENAIQFAGL
jgi:hypothetical protein